MAKKATIPELQANIQSLEQKIKSKDLDLVSNALMTRTDLISKLMDSRRDINDECGYPTTVELGPELYKAMYDREAVAARVVEVLPDESWKVQPSVFEFEDIDQVTEFETAWQDLDKNLRSTNTVPSFYQDEEGSPIWDQLSRLDILSGIGTFGVMLLGLDDGAALIDPVEVGREHRLLFLRSFDESLVEITAYDNEPTSPRFSQPERYKVSFTETTDSSGTTSMTLATLEVHWSRIIHVIDNARSSETFGVPRMQPVYNRLYDLRKLYSGSAEMYWRGAFPGLSLESHPSLGGDIEMSPADETAIRGQMTNYMNTLQRYLLTSGMTAKSLAPQVVDPTSQVDVQIEAICIRLDIPKRIFTGSERGELASSQDAKRWNRRLSKRQNDQITPRIIVPFIDRLIGLGVLPEPEGYSVVWPDLEALSDLEKAEISLKKTDALVKYVAGGVEALIHPLDYLVRFLNTTPEEAKAILEKTMESEEPITLPDEEELEEGDDDAGSSGSKKSSESSDES